MVAARSTDGSLEDLPQSMRAAIGISRDWMELAACKGDHGEQRAAWRAARNDRTPVDGVPAKTLIAYALAVCARCPVQWSCAEFAIDTGAAVGTWGVAFEDLTWLARQRGWRALLTTADYDDVTVAVAVRDSRHGPC